MTSQRKYSPGFPKNFQVVFWDGDATMEVFDCDCDSGSHMRSSSFFHVTSSVPWNRCIDVTFSHINITRPTCQWMHICSSNCGSSYAVNKVTKETTNDEGDGWICRCVSNNSELKSDDILEPIIAMDDRLFPICLRIVTCSVFHGSRGIPLLLCQ